VARGGLGNLHVDLGQGSHPSCPFKLAYRYLFFCLPVARRATSCLRRERHSLVVWWCCARRALCS